MGWRGWRLVCRGEVESRGLWWGMSDRFEVGRGSRTGRRSSRAKERFAVSACGLGKSLETVIRFEWDHRKNSANRKKHKVSFEEAQTAFYDEDALLSRRP